MNASVNDEGLGPGSLARWRPPVRVRAERCLALGLSAGTRCSMVVIGVSVREMLGFQENPRFVVQRI